MGDRHQPRVMLLERNDALRQILEEAFVDLGFEALPADTRKEALDRLLHDPDPDLLFVDLVDEAAGGEALLSFIAEQPDLARIPLVVVTDGGEPTGAAARAAHLVKPFDADAFRTAVLEAMAGRAERPGLEHQHPGT